VIKPIRRFFLEENQGKVKLSQRAVIFFFCLVLSSFFWLLSALSKEYNSRMQIPLNYTELAGFFVLTEDPPKSIEVEVRGTGFELLGEQWALDNSPLQINLNSAKPSSRPNQFCIPTFKLRTRVIKTIDPNLSLRYISPDTLYFKTENRYGKKLPLQAKLDLTFASGYHLRSPVQLDPDSIWVSGPASFIDTVSAVYTEPMKFSKLDDSAKRVLAIQNYEIDGVKLEPEQTMVLIPVEKFTEKELNLRIKVVNEVDQRQIRTYPKEITALFLVPLSKFEYLDTSVVKGVVTFTEAELDKKQLKVELNGVPPYAKLLRKEVDKVEFIIKE